MATLWHTPYFCERLTALSPAVLLGLMSPASESERLEEEEPLRLTLGPAPRRSLRLNLWPSVFMEAGLLRRAGGTGEKAGGGLRPGFGFLGLSLALARKPETPAEMLGALLAGRLG